MLDKGRRLIASGGAGLMVSGAALLLTAGAAPVQAATHSAHHRSHAPASATTCGSQGGLNDPTNSNNHVLTGYYFAVEHGGVTINVCSLLNNTHPGDIVTAYFTLHSGSTQATQLSLVSYKATDEDTNQTLFDCASFGVSSGSCVSTTANALTVRVPPCGFQVDLIYGAPVQSHVKGSYFAAHTWINGQISGLHSEAVCTDAANATPTPTPALGGVNAITTTATTPSTPSTGVGSTTQAALGIILMTLGGSAVVYGRRRLKTTEV